MFLYPTFIRSISSAVGGAVPAAKAGEEVEVVVRVTRAVDPARMKKSRRDDVVACMAVVEEIILRLLFLLISCWGANA